MSEVSDLALAALSRGDLIGAYDITASAIAAGDASPDVRHRQVLALARMGDTERAMEHFTAYGLDRSRDPHHRAIGARLLKDRALALPAGDARHAALRAAFDAYYTIHAESGDPFPGINAATLALLAGDRIQAASLAEALLADSAVAADRDYYQAATRAEALLLLGRVEEVAELLRGEAIAAATDHGARSGTARQLGMIAAHLGIADAAALLAPLAPPKVAHFCGHMFTADMATEAALAERISAVLDEEGAGFVYGALACGGDLLVAETALARGIELNVVLPFAREDFLSQSVRPGGAGWETRYRACLAQAASVTIASEMEYFGDPAQYGYGSRMAMGLARLRAQHLGAEAVQIAIWDGVASDGPAGTGADVAAWEVSGGRVAVIDPGPIDRRLARPAPRVDGGGHERMLAAILFTDFAGFSTLRETALPAFWGGVMRTIADVLDAHDEGIACRNSWGDALYAVASSASLAARVALELQDALADFDYATLGLETGGGMRVAAHYGPAWRTSDPITGRATFYGTEVSKAARIEPVTPPGAVFVTEPFAAILALEAGESFACRYVGRIALAKNYGEFPMYRLSRKSTAGW
jgi:adenylate cyclase